MKLAYRDSLNYEHRQFGILLTDRKIILAIINLPPITFKWEEEKREKLFLKETLRTRLSNNHTSLINSFPVWLLLHGH